jgi:uncharacterized protein DUF6636
MRLAPPIITTLVLAVTLVPAASADSVTFFRTPSKNIYCAREKFGPTDMLRCDVRDLAHQAPKPKGCKFGWGTSFGVNARGRAHALCVSDSVFDPHAKTLAYGKTRHLGPFTCTSKTSGLRCSNRSGHGFVLNRTRYRFF